MHALEVNVHFSLCTGVQIMMAHLAVPFAVRQFFGWQGREAHLQARTLIGVHGVLCESHGVHDATVP